MNDSSLRNPHCLNLCLSCRTQGLSFHFFSGHETRGKGLGWKVKWRVLESSGHEGGNKTEQERAEPATGARQAGRKNICMGRWAKFLITPSGEETCDSKLRTGLQLFSQDSFRVWHVLSFAGGMTRMLKAC